jgi:hypothetical protein
VPGATEVLRMPPGDRAPRLRYLARYHRGELATLNDVTLSARGARIKQTRHRRALSSLTWVAGRVGVDLLDAAP